MRYLLGLIVTIMVLASCGTENNESSAPTKLEVKELNGQPELSAEELESRSKEAFAKMLDVSTLNLVLNEDEKWVVSKEVFTKLMKVKQQVYVISGNMENYTEDSYKEIGAEFLSFLKDFPVQNDKKVNSEVQKVVSATKDQCVVMLSGHLQNAQISVINLSLIYDEVPTFFVVEK